MCEVCISSRVSLQKLRFRSANVSHRKRPGVLPPDRYESAIQCALEPETSASTNSATSAQWLQGISAIGIERVGVLASLKR